MNYVLWEKQNFAMNNLYNLLFKGWFRLKGRSGVKEFAFRILFVFLVNFLVSSNVSSMKLLTNFIISSPLLLITLALHYFDITSYINSLLVVPIIIISLIQIFFVTHRRLHDINASGWWQLIILIPFGQLIILCLLFLKGTPGPNKYGPPPEY